MEIKDQLCIKLKKIMKKFIEKEKISARYITLACRMIID